MADIVDTFFQYTGWNEDHSLVATYSAILNYSDLAVFLFFSILTFLSIVYWTEDLSIRIYGFLWLFVVVHMFAFIVCRLYHRSTFREMYRYSLIAGLPENYRRKILLVIIYYFVVANVHVFTPLMYTIAFDSVHMGDPFTYPFMDVFPGKKPTMTVYLCKYIIYAIPLYLTHLEGCLFNTTFMHSTGVMKILFQTLNKQVEEAMIIKDEQKLKIALKQHQELLKFFRKMETVYEKQILLSIEFCGVYIGLTSFIMIQVIQGVIHPLLLGLCTGSIIEGLSSITVYCFYGSIINDLHDGTLNSLFNQQTCYFRDKSFKQLVVIMMARVSIPLEFKAGSIFTINLNLFVKILKFTYTIFNFLLTSVNRK